MKRRTRNLAIAATFLLAAGQAAAQERPRVMILGTYHMANPGADLQNVEADDVTSEARQAELRRLADRLEEFSPTKIAVELPLSDSTRLQRWFEAWRGDSLTAIPTSELDQISFRLADRLGHDRLYPIDHKQALSMQAVLEYARENGQVRQAERALAASRTVADSIAVIQSRGTVTDILRYLNSEAVDRAHAFYMALAPVGSGAAYPGAEMVADWYERNLKIFANIWRLADSAEERILVVIGAGHGTLLREFVEASPDLELVRAARYLR